MQLNFQDSPLRNVLSLIQDLTGKTVTVDLGVQAKISLKTESRVTKSKALEMIQQALAEQGITITELNPHTLRVSGPPPETKRMTIEDARTGPSYAERRAKHLRQEMRTNEIIAARFTDDELRGHLIKYRQEIEEAGLPQPALSEKEKELGINIDDFQHAPPRDAVPAARPPRP